MILWLSEWAVGLNCYTQPFYRMAATQFIFYINTDDTYAVLFMFRNWKVKIYNRAEDILKSLRASMPPSPDILTKVCADMLGMGGIGKQLIKQGAKILKLYILNIPMWAYCSNPPSLFEALKLCYFCLGWENVHELHQGWLWGESKIVQL